MVKEFSYFKSSVVHRSDGSWVKNLDNIGLLNHAINIRLEKMLIVIDLNPFTAKGFPIDE